MTRYPTVTLSGCCANQSLLYPINAKCQARQQQVSICYVTGLTWLGYKLSTFYTESQRFTKLATASSNIKLYVAWNDRAQYTCRIFLSENVKPVTDLEFTLCQERFITKRSCCLFVVALRHGNSILVISWQWYDVWDEKEKYERNWPLMRL